MNHLLPIGLAAAFLSTGAAAAQYQDLDALDARIAATLAGSGTAVPIDRRIKLAPCPEEPEITRMTGAFSLRCPAIGWRILVAVNGATGNGAPGSEAPAPVLVHRGDTIELVARGPGYSASLVATALDEGALGAAIRVKIPTSASPVSAVIARAGMATIAD